MVVRESEQPDSPIVAAGNVEGEVAPRGELLVMLEPAGESGVTGLAYFVPDEQVDDETEVTIIVWDVELPGTPAG